MLAKSLIKDGVAPELISVINFIRSRALNHRLFKGFLEAEEMRYAHVLYFSDVRLLSRSKFLKRFWNFRLEINEFMNIKGKVDVQFKVPNSFIIVYYC